MDDVIGANPPVKLGVHLRTHNGGTPHPCSTCPKRFASAKLLSKHLRTHLLPEHCPMCGQACKSRSDLGVHLRTHTGEKPFKCTTCSRDFARKQDLKIHCRIHTGETPFKCDSCPMAFRYSSFLTTHKARAHVDGSEEKVGPKAVAENQAPVETQSTSAEGNGLEFYVDQDFHLKELSVPILRMTCKTVGDGVEEYSSCEGDSHFVCSRCGRGHRDEGSAKGHVLQCKVHVCLLCSKSFATPFSLKRHLALVHEKAPGPSRTGAGFVGNVSSTPPPSGATS